MKIARIRLEGFRAFNEPFELDLLGGKNLLLHGENGSGKSSLFFALKRFFEERGGDVSVYRSLFSPVGRISAVKLTVSGTDNNGTQYNNREFAWAGVNHPLVPPGSAPPHSVSPSERSALVGAAHRSGFLEYRDLLRLSLFARPFSRYATANDLHRQPYGQGLQDLGEQVFDIITWVILEGVRPTGPGAKTIGQLVRRVWEHNPRTRYKSVVDKGLAAINEFNAAFAALLPQLEAKVEELLAHFANHQVRITFDWQPLEWNRDYKRIDHARLLPRITFREQDLANRSHDLLNEARISAIGLCIFFAGVMLSDTDTGNPAYLRLLMLDDALIGLDLGNRIPVLRILRSAAFQHYQKILLTHDRVWFDLARGHLPESDGWIHRELVADESTGQLIPRTKSSQADIDRAKEHVANGDLRAAGVYARAAFECRLQNICQDKGIDIKYRKDPKEQSVDKLWQAILVRQKHREEHRLDGHPNAPDFIPPNLVRDVELMRSTVLNQLSHANAPGLVAADVRSAIATIETLFLHSFPNA